MIRHITLINLAEGFWFFFGRNSNYSTAACFIETGKII